MKNDSNFENFRLSQDELNFYKKNGFIGPFTLYSREEMNEMWKKIRYELTDTKFAPYSNIGYTGATNISNYDRHLDIDLLSKHICRPEIVHRVNSIMGNDLLCWRTEFFPKYKGDEGTDWHQADTFANASGTPQILWPKEDNVPEGQGTITVWTAFTEANKDMGCLQFIPGTHREMFYDESKRMDYYPDLINNIDKDGIKRGFFGYDYRQLQIDSDWVPDESKAISMEMSPGQFIIFSSTLMHASHPHAGKTNEMRMGYATRYVPTRVQIYPNTEFVIEYGGSISLEKYFAVLVSGENKYLHNKVTDKNIRGTPFM